MYLDKEKKISFIYESDFLHFGKVNVFVRFTYNERRHILFFEDGNTRHLLGSFEGKCLCRKSANFYKIHRLQNLIRNSLTEIEGDFISIMTTMNLEIPEQLLSQLACC